MLPFDEAQARVVAAAVRLPAETVPLAAAHGRVLAESLHATTDHPAFDASTMDGFALRASDGGAAPFELPVDGEATPGTRPPPLVPGTARRIFTGAPLPPGADAVEMQEEVAFDTDRKSARFARVSVAGRFVRRAGSDAKRGELVLSAGTRLGAAQLGLVAALDRAEVSVARSPRVAFLMTGDELRAPGAAGSPTSIPEAIAPALAAMAAAAGASVVSMARVGDDRAATDDAVVHALSSADVLVTVGGASVGAHDHARASLEAAGVAIDFFRIAMKPGKPVALGRRGDVTALALPGNPASAMITFALLGVPLLRAMQGDAAPLPRMHRAVLGEPIRREPGRTEFVRVAFAARTAEPAVVALAQQASGSLVGMARADALLRIEADVAALDAGASVRIYLASEIFP